MNIVHTSEVAKDATSPSAHQPVLDAAREIFVRDGYDGFSMRKLATALGCAVGTIYLRFKSKDELFHRLVEQSFERLFEGLRRLRDRHQNGDPVILLKKGMYTYVEFGLRNPNDYRFAFLVRALPAEGPYQVHPAFEMMRFMVGRCVQEGRFREVDVETVSQALWAAIHGITSLLIQRPNFPWVGRAKVIEQVINNAVDSLVVQHTRVADV